MVQYPSSDSGFNFILGNVRSSMQENKLLYKKRFEMEKEKTTMNPSLADYRNLAKLKDY